MTTNPRRPPFDPDVAEALARMAEESANGTPWTMATTLRLDNLAELRELSKDAFGEDLNAFGAECEDFLIPGHLGDEIALSVYRRPGSSGPRPCVFNIHGGGMVIGDRFFGLSLALPWIKEHDAVVTTVEYRLAPEYPDPYPVEDCYAALEWVAEHAEEIGVDIGRLVLVGASAGGGLAAGTALLARDRGGPVPAGQMLLCPMLDDRDHTDSARQFEGLGVWNRESNRTGWAALLGERSGDPMCRSTRPRAGRPTSPDSPRRSSTSDPRRCSATRTSPTPHASGPTEASRNCTSGPEAPMRGRSWRPAERWPGRRRPYATPGWPVCSLPDEITTMGCRARCPAAHGSWTETRGHRQRP